MNTTDIAITHWDDSSAIEYIVSKTGIPLKRYTDSIECGGPKITYFETDGASVPCLTKEQHAQLLDAFNEAPFSSPEVVSLHVICDNHDEFDKVTLRSEWYAD